MKGPSLLVSHRFKYSPNGGIAVLVSASFIWTILPPSPATPSLGHMTPHIELPHLVPIPQSAYSIETCLPAVICHLLFVVMFLVEDLKKSEVKYLLTYFNKNHEINLVVEISWQFI